MIGLKTAITTSSNANLLVGSGKNGVAKEWADKEYVDNIWGFKEYVVFNHTALPTDATTFTLSFEAKSTVDGDIVVNYFYNPNTVQEIFSCQMNEPHYTSGKSDGSCSLKVTTSYKKYWIRYKGEWASSRNVIVARLFKNKVSGKVSVKNAKLEVGGIPTDWCPNEADLGGGNT